MVELYLSKKFTPEAKKILLNDWYKISMASLEFVEVKLFTRVFVSRKNSYDYLAELRINRFKHLSEYLFGFGAKISSTKVMVINKVLHSSAPKLRKLYVGVRKEWCSQILYKMILFSFYRMVKERSMWAEPLKIDLVVEQPKIRTMADRIDHKYLLYNIGKYCQFYDLQIDKSLSKFGRITTRAHEHFHEKCRRMILAAAEQLQRQTLSIGSPMYIIRDNQFTLTEMKNDLNSPALLFKLNTSFTASDRKNI